MWLCCCSLLLAGVAAQGGISGFAQQLEPAGLCPFTEAAAAAFPVAEMWYFVEGITESGVHFAYLNTVARYSTAAPFAALRPVFGASVGDLCAIGKPLGVPFSGLLMHINNMTAVTYEAAGASFGIASSPASPFVVSIEDTSAGVSSHTTAFGPMFTFQYSDVSVEGSPRAAYVQAMGACQGTLHGEQFTGWGGVEYHRGYQGWGTAPPFADYWYRHWLLRANLTAAEPSYSMAIVGSEDSGFTGGYRRGCPRRVAGRAHCGRLPSRGLL